ncbi:Type II site-specific deoxyribonuclease [Flexistipes sinusarabici DSM 4947]|uniref:type II site-specific deoxyribonuclease n=1 Tax=Flexistipes sinusarabici (strain ATCC 49648 / DSM 4947 / MAS 10) TaxID=717231 RepID=F8E8Y2_FLESM|nr:TdeIII family type II restriction endonuclease [Flexistipes sinusarabici]AEI14106.1 Type II site-specific deoxyribonuclease [Flexistipes sinusarabici DSM 4947]
MALENRVKEKIAIEVIKVLISRFDSFPEDASNIRNAPFHDAFLNAFADKLDGKVPDTPFFISLASWLHGLNTTLGQTFFENVAQILSDGEKREYTSKKLGNLTITKNHREKISEIAADLSTSTELPDLERENKLLLQNYDGENIKAVDFSADVFFEDEDQVIAIEIKSVKPNSGEMKGEKQKILEGKAALQKKFPKKEIYFYIGFPFDPTVDPAEEKVTGYNKERFLRSIINMSKFFDPEETLVASELWDFLSGQKNTMEQILEIINNIATPDFLEKFRYLKSGENRYNQDYIPLLDKWFLSSEKELVQNDGKIKDKIENDKRLTRIYNKQPFDAKGSYMFERYIELKELV